MRILVTGGAGFIGSHLCERLISERDEVIALDNFFTGSKENVRSLNGHYNFEILRHDLITPIDLEVDRIFNLACPASPVHYQFDPVRTIQANVLGVTNMLELAKRTRARILQASTSEVYGDPKEHPQTEKYWGNVNPIGIRSCYDAATEILTENGWVPFPELKDGVRVATLNPQGAVEYHVPEERIEQAYVGELLRFSNAKFDFCVTPNHSMYVRSKTGKLRFLRADEDRHWPAWTVMTGGKYEGSEPEWFDLGPAPRNAKVHVDRVRMDDWLEFLGYYLSEGCVHVRHRVRAVGGTDYAVADYNVLVAQQDPDNRRKMAACLSRIGFKFFDSDDRQFRICSMQLANLLIPFGHAGDKYIPRELLCLSPRQSRILLDALILGDGSERGDSKVYYSKSRQMADDVQELAMRCGFAASVVSHAVGRDLWRVNIRPPVEANLVEPERIPYAGNVYCVNVANHVICVRRNGRAAWCGNCYDEGKRVAETLMFDYHRQHEIPIRVARIFNTYGPRMALNDGRVVSNLIVQALSGKDMTIYGDGSQTRSFCFVDDLVDGLIRLMDKEDFTGPVNLGNPVEFTILQLAELLIKMTGSKSKIIHKPLPQDDPTQRKPDITLARTQLGWEPRVPLEQGLGKTISYFEKKLSARGVSG